MMSLAKYAWGRALLLKFPGLFSYGLVSHEGPTQEQMEKTTCEVMLYGSGYAQGAPEGPPGAKPDKKVSRACCAGHVGVCATDSEASGEHLGVPGTAHFDKLHACCFCVLAVTAGLQLSGFKVCVVMGSASNPV